MPVTLKLWYQPALSHPYSEAQETRPSAFPKLPDPLTLCCTSRWAGNHEMASKLRSFPRLCPAHSPAGQPIIIPRVEKQNSATAVSKLSHLGAAEKQHSCSSPEKWAFPRIGLPWPPERSFLCHQCPHLDNLTQMIYGQFWTKIIFIPLLIRTHQIQYGTFVSLKCDDIIYKWRSQIFGTDHPTKSDNFLEKF